MHWFSFETFMITSALAYMWHAQYLDNWKNKNTHAGFLQLESDYRSLEKHAERLQKKVTLLEEEKTRAARK